MKVNELKKNHGIKITASQVTQPELEGRQLKSGGYRPLPFLSDKSSSPGELDPYLAAFAAGLSELSYADASDIEKLLLAEGATRLKHFGVTDGPDLDPTYALSFILDRRAWIAVRGTNDLFDWGRNLLMMPLYHPGFRLVWSTIREDVNDWLNSNSARFDVVVFTGHSLGGAVAKLAAFEATGEHSMPVEAVITFGAPRVGSPWFAKRYNSQVCNLTNDSTRVLQDCTHRFEGSGDVVAAVPPFLFGFKHVGKFGEVPSQHRQHTETVSPVFEVPVTSLKRRIEGAIDKCIELGGLLAPTLPILYVLKIVFWGAERPAHHKMLRYSQDLGHKFAFHEVLSGIGQANEVPFKNRPRLDGLCIFAFLVSICIAVAVLIGIFMVCRAALGEHAIIMLVGLVIFFVLFLYGKMD